jgi:hypothetical protein
VQYPYIFISPPVTVSEAVDFDNAAGISYRPAEGIHAIWATRVPFLPAMLSADFTRFGKERTPFVRERQFRFIYDLARAREHRATFDLRFIATPNPVPGQPNLIDIVFFGKVFAGRSRGGALPPQRAQALAERLWEKFVSNFPAEDPFNYPLEPVADVAEFARVYEPIRFSELGSEHLLEIRKYEDMPIRSTAVLGRVERKGDYIAHPFVPTVDFTPMNRFFAALAVQPQCCYAGISIRPTRMFDQEVFNVSFAIGQFKRTASEDDDVTEEYIRARSAVGIYVYKELMEEREQLVQVRVHLVGEHSAPYGLAEALGSEMMGNANNVYPTQWVAAQPADDREFAAALTNLRYLEHEYWGHTIAPPPLARLRYLATAREAYGAFRLPVPPESGYMAGVLVKSEPFVAPTDDLELRLQAQANLNDANAATSDHARERKVQLGTVYHRGSATRQSFTINVRDLTRHTLIAGSTGSGKSTTIRHLLAQLWLEHQVPFLVLYPIDKPDYRELRGFPDLARDLLIFTLGDESTAPFRFNPFEAPEGVLLKTHLSRLMRVFTAAFTLQDPLPMIYREALRRVYREHGWDPALDRARADRTYPVMSEFYATIKQIADGLDYGREVKDNVRQASVIRIGDLLENAGHVVNVRRSMPLGTVLNRPAVMEIGRVGSMQDTTLLMGFLLMRFAEEVERAPRPLDRPHITVVEEAHRLMAESVPVAGGIGGDSRSSAGEDFSNILAEVRGFGEGLVIAEQIPTLLVKGAIGNTNLKIMHWLEDAPSFELFSSIMNLNEEQREYVRALPTGFAVVRSPYGRPVHIKVPEFGDQPGYDRTLSPDNSDDSVRAFMADQRLAVGLDDVPLVPWQASLAATGGTNGAWRAPAEALNLLLAAPMQSCAFCRPLHETRRCQYGQTVRRRLLTDAPLLDEQRRRLDAALTQDDLDTRWQEVRRIGDSLSARLATLSPADQRGMTYCFLAHLVEDVLTDARANPSPDGQRPSRSRGLLQQFDGRYQDGTR